MDELVAGLMRSYQGATGELFTNPAVARDYWRNTASSHEVTDRLLSMTSISPSDLVADVGCGTGLSTERIARLNPKKIIALDPAEAMLAEARKKKLRNAAFQLASVEDIGRYVSHANKIISVKTFCYFKTPAQALSRIHRALAKNGEYLFDCRVITEYDCHPNQFLFDAISSVSSDLGNVLEFNLLTDPLKPRQTRDQFENMIRASSFSSIEVQEKVLETPRLELEETVQKYLANIRRMMGSEGEDLADRIETQARQNLPTTTLRTGLVCYFRAVK